jgi:hypothetical protein
MLHPVVTEERPESGRGVEVCDHTAEARAVRRFGLGTLLAIGISTRSVAPASRSAGMTRLMLRFSTTDSTAYPPPASGDIVGDFIDGSTASTASRCSSSTLSFSRTRQRASSTPLSRVMIWPIALRFCGSAAASRLAITSV